MIFPWCHNTKLREESDGAKAKMSAFGSVVAGVRWETIRPIVTYSAISNADFSGPRVIAVCLSKPSNNWALILLTAGLDLSAATMGPARYDCAAASLSNR